MAVFRRVLPLASTGPSDVLLALNIGVYGGASVRKAMAFRLSAMTAALVTVAKPRTVLRSVTAQASSAAVVARAAAKNVAVGASGLVSKVKAATKFVRTGSGAASVVRSAVSFLVSSRVVASVSSIRRDAVLNVPVTVRVSIDHLCGSVLRWLRGVTPPADAGVSSVSAPAAVALQSAVAPSDVAMSNLTAPASATLEPDQSAADVNMNSEGCEI